MIPHRTAPRTQLIAALALCLLAVAVPARAAMSPDAVRAPRLVEPTDDALVHEGGLKLAWQPLAAGDRHFVLVARRPFDATGWTQIPDHEAIHVREVPATVATLDDLGVTPGPDRRLFWAAAEMDPATGRVRFSATRAMTVVPRFANAPVPAPELRTSSILRAQPAVRTGPDRIRLRAGYEIDPSGVAPAVPAGLRAAPAPGGTGTFLVYYGDDDPVTARDRILAAGGRVVAYVPDRAFLVRMPGAAAAAHDALARDLGVRWVGDYQPAYKLSPRLEADAQGTRTVNVLLFEDGDLDGAAAAAAGLGAQVVRRSSNGINKLMRLELPAPAVQGLANHPDVAWIEPYVPFEMDNKNVQWIVQTAQLNDRRVWSMGLKGEGQVLMTSDSGIFMTHDMFRDPGVPVTAFGDYPTHRKVIAYKLGSANPGVQFGDHSGAGYHGTHTAGTLLGNNDGYTLNADSLNDGQAKNARMYFMDISGTALGTGVDPFLDLNDLFQPPYDGNGAGAARISSNSWGAANGGAYDLPALTADQFVWNHPDFLIFFSNGNSGGPNTVGSPATSKNTVGAGGTVNYTSSLPQIDQIYTSTSRGPTDDGRRKPTICAPGQSVRSSIGSNFVNNAYTSYSGTSMASPSMAGAAALIRQYLTEGWYPTGVKTPGNGFEPSAALLKAMCVNSAANTITGYTAPDDNIGYGRIKADDVLYFAGDTRRLLLADFTSGLGNGDAIEYQVNVTDGAVPLEVTLCWSDYPGNPAVLNQLVNDLNLTVTNGIVTYLGNVYSGGVSVTGGSYDATNVEEAVLVNAPTTGVWTIRIEGNNVPIGPQPFGLCITGGVGTTAGAVALDRAAYGAASTVAVRVVDTNAGPTVDVTLTSDTEPTGETVTLTGADGVFTGTLDLSPYDGSMGDNLLQVSHGDVITATYQDASPSATLVATAGVTIAGPVITDVLATNQGGVVTVNWNTDINASSKVYYGPTPALGQETALDPAAALVHPVTIVGTTVGATYYYDVESQDLNGNVTRDDNGGQHYRFTVNPPADLLLVMDGSFERPQYYETALATNEFEYDTWGPELAANPPLGNLDYGMRAYKVVWWQPGLEQYPPLSDAARDSITAYLGGGGRFAICGHDIAWAFSDPGSGYYTADRAAWVNNTLHALFQSDPAGWTGIKGILGDPISGLYVGGVSYTEHRAGASGDEIDLVGGGGSVNYVWRSVETTPDDCSVRWLSSGPLGSPGSAFWGGQASRLVSMFFEWTGIQSVNPASATRADIMDRTLAWLLGRGRPFVVVTAPNGGETLTGSSVDITWVETPAAGTSIVSRRIDYSLDGGQSWTLISDTPGSSPYAWDLTSVPNSAFALVRITVEDNGTPAFTRTDASDAVFTIQHSGGDVLGPVVVAGSVASDPNPIDNRKVATLTATISDANASGSDVVQAEYSIGDSPAAAGTGYPMGGTFPGITVAVTASVNTSVMEVGLRKLWVRGRDAEGNWGPASALAVVVNGVNPTGVEDLPVALQLRQNAPNPVIGSTRIVFGLPARGAVSLAIHDVQGRRVRELLRGEVAPGLHSVGWDRTDDAGHAVQPGVYFLRMVTGDRTLIKRMVTLR